jgi:hypothetical protein
MGYRVAMTRDGDAPPDGGRDLTGDHRVGLADDLQARVDAANASGAAVLLSVHFNGSADRRLRGPEVYFSADRPFAEENKRLADALLTAVRQRLAAEGVRVAGRGVLPDQVLGGGPLYLLGPAGGRIARASAMPGVLAEPLYLTNLDDARLLAQPRVLEALAQGYADGLAAYLGPPARRALVAGPTGANLRPSPLLAAAPLAVVPRGAPVELAELVHGDAVGDRSDWWRVDWRGQAGFVFGRLVAPLASAAPTATPTAMAVPVPTAAPTPVPTAAATTPAPADADTSGPRRATVRDDGDGLRVRIHSDPRRDAPILVRARPGESLDVIASARGEAVDGRRPTWLKVRRNETVGWLWAPLTDAGA